MRGTKTPENKVKLQLIPAPFHLQKQWKYGSDLMRSISGLLIAIIEPCLKGAADYEGKS